MISVDEAALRCDLMETYHIFDYRALPARQVALFACGLNENSRIMRKISGAPAGFDSMMLAVIADALRILVWQNTENGAKGINQPQSIMAAILNRDADREQQGFESAADFEAWRRSLFEGVGE